MLPNVVRSSTDRLIVAAVRCAWSQWSSIGALTHRGPQVDSEIVDVEALLLGSLGLARREPRLRDVATDWTVRNSKLVSIARINALLDPEGPFSGTGVDVRVLAGAVATYGGDARWRALAPSRGEAAVDVTAQKDRVVKASSPRWRGARTMLLQLRRGFGVGVKPDLIAILLGNGGAWLEVSTLADLSQYTVAGVRRAADDMAEAGLIETTQGHNRAYRANIAAWQTMFPDLQAPVWRRRADGFAFVLRWQRSLSEKEVSFPSEFALAIEFGTQMKQFWRLWHEAGVTQEPVSDDSGSAWTARNGAIDSLVRWFEDRAHYGDEYDPAAPAPK